MGEPGAGSRRLTVYRQQESMGAAGDLDFALELLQRARNGSLGPSLRLYRPQPTVAFGQRDANLPGFAPRRRLAGSSVSSPSYAKQGAEPLRIIRGPW
jgi:hypothetical protein